MNNLIERDKRSLHQRFYTGSISNVESTFSLHLLGEILHYIKNFFYNSLFKLQSKLSPLPYELDSLSLWLPWGTLPGSLSYSPAH